MGGDRLQQIGLARPHRNFLAAIDLQLDFQLCGLVLHWA